MSKEKDLLLRTPGGFLEGSPFRSAFSPRERVSLAFVGPGKAKQSFRDECDVNVIMKRFAVSGVLPNAGRLPPEYGDVTGLDFQTMLNQVVAAQAAFQALPAVVRRRFGNDPKEFVDFCSDRGNMDEVARMGLAAFVKGKSDDTVSDVGERSRVDSRRAERAGEIRGASVGEGEVEGDRGGDGEVQVGAPRPLRKGQSRSR